MKNLSLPHNLFAMGEELKRDFPLFERKISQLAEVMNISLSAYVIDHLALRSNSETLAKSWLTLLLKCGTILSDNRINGRPIYLIRLHQPLIFAGQAVEVIELPFPKNKHYPQEGWEHIELVMPFLSQESVAEWQERILSLFGWNRSAHLKVKISEPKGEGERLPNPSIAVSLADQSENHTCIKVHPYSIQRVVGLHSGAKGV
ncbi:hypothetical protein EDC45_1392 [Mesocricetibacter intestinalis]|uniref:VOC family protein n=1 Tax=Mesocricetibacter intestinalis TaxID=1521930 RepID=A0A4R6VBA9_9PAST|nr:VOC family protein [Mesocricetibacter intestinalis]TDQ57338.1 hypothetical protein EDC45_1392 [Mesocricetibacter intestinalis]